MRIDFDRIIPLSAFSVLMILFGTLSIRSTQTYSANVTSKTFTSNIPEMLFADTEQEPIEEETCIMYAKQSIGRYYITAYSDLETGCKTTASGKKVHEGTITTCAIDRKLHKFGTIFEIDGKLYIAEDTGGAVKGKHVDIFIHDMKKMSKYGSNHQEIYKVTFPFGKPK